MAHMNVDREWRNLRRNHLSRVGPAGLALPRRTIYGHTEPWMIPYGEQYPDHLIKPSDYKGVIQHCHERGMFPIYHQRNTWGPPGFHWDQDGLGFCWAWGVAAACMDCRAREGKPVPLLSPVTLGWLVGWQNQGNYLDDALRGVRERGIAEMAYTPAMHSLDYLGYKSGWEENGLQYRLEEVWDCNNFSDAAMIQHAITILATGTALYVGYYWWGHAVQCCGVKWDETEENNLVWLIRNSHNENDVIEMVGTRAVPDDAFGVRAMRTET